MGRITDGVSSGILTYELDRPLDEVERRRPSFVACFLEGLSSFGCEPLSTASEDERPFSFRGVPGLVRGVLDWDPMSNRCGWLATTGPRDLDLTGGAAFGELTERGDLDGEVLSLSTLVAPPSPNSRVLFPPGVWDLDFGFLTAPNSMTISSAGSR